MQPLVDPEISPEVLRTRLKAEGLLAFAFRRPAEISRLAFLLASLCPQPQTAVVGLLELMANAVEHGVLGIGYHTKLHLRRSLSLEDEIERLLGLPENLERQAEVVVELKGDRLWFTVSDPGEGFDWKPFESFSPERAAEPSGRGIALARCMGFDRIEYQGVGNRVQAVISAPGQLQE
ncbi:MAG: hypothetical protein EKK46_07325 [Rhodocyclaceae bacterium]|nr:MAG: hypothetical protein EKK46_07325 [Rhodocyclaceae bacterium]